jgi:hypothetical protein
MELQFNKGDVAFLHRAVDQAQTQEQTQEIRIGDGMPEIGRVLGCWGQVMIRGKEWRGNGISIQGGVKLCVLYAPEEGDSYQSVEAWLPFQMKWDLKEDLQDGTILVQPMLKSADARGVSSRKLMVRANISCGLQAYSPSHKEVYSPVQVPEDVCLLRRSYPVMLPKEAGEKLMQLDDELPLKKYDEKPWKLHGCWLIPSVTEQRVMTDKLIFRGKGKLCMICSCEEGKPEFLEQEISFSQYAQLNEQISANAMIRSVPILSNLELEPGEGKLYIKAGIVMQYLIYDRQMLELVEDAYSPRRSVKVQLQPLVIPSLLDSVTETVRQRQNMQADQPQLLRCDWRGEFPSCANHNDTLNLEQEGQMHFLYADAEGQLQGAAQRGKLQWQLPSFSDNHTLVYLQAPEVECYSDHEGLAADISLTYSADTVSTGMMDMVSALELGECAESDPMRPSLVVKRSGADSIWSLAKACGSTVEAILEANGLEEAPKDDRLLLIPVL